MIAVLVLLMVPMQRPVPHQSVSKSGESSLLEMRFILKRYVEESNWESITPFATPTIT